MQANVSSSAAYAQPTIIISLKDLNMNMLDSRRQRSQFPIDRRFITSRCYEYNHFAHHFIYIVL